MRIGQNPAKLHAYEPRVARHDVIMPVYIPHTDGYFSDAISILGICLDSLRSTTVDLGVHVTVISDGSCNEAQAFLRERYNTGQIDLLILQKANLGKIDTLVGVLRGSPSQVVTVCDSDVLFLPGWLQETERLFATFPHCGIASVVPQPNLAYYQTSATILGALARRMLTIESVANPDDLESFTKSVGNPDLYEPWQIRRQMVVKRNGVTACVGAGHFVMSIRPEVIARMPTERSGLGLEQGSEQRWLDEPGESIGAWRLSTTRSFARHMGNVLEDWMRVRPPLDGCSSRHKFQVSERIKRDPISAIPPRIRQAIVSRLIRPKLDQRWKSP